MNKDIKILGLVLIGLFGIFLVSGSITGGSVLSGIRTWWSSSKTPESTVLRTTQPTGTCIDLTEGQCKTVCGDFIVGGTEECMSECEKGTGGCIKEPYDCDNKEKYSSTRAKSECCRICCLGDKTRGTINHCIDACLAGCATIVAYGGDDCSPFCPGMCGYVK